MRPYLWIRICRLFIKYQRKKSWTKGIRHFYWTQHLLRWGKFQFRWKTNPDEHNNPITCFEIIWTNFVLFWNFQTKIWQQYYIAKLFRFNRKSVFIQVANSILYECVSFFWNDFSKNFLRSSEIVVAPFYKFIYCPTFYFHKTIGTFLILQMRRQNSAKIFTNFLFVVRLAEV